MKVCVKCGLSFNDRQCKVCKKIIDAAYRAANRDKAIAYREANKDRRATRDKAYRAANKEKITAYRIANTEKIALRNAAYRAANTEKHAAYGAVWRAKNLECYRIYNQNRRAKQRVNGGNISKDLPKKLHKLQKGKCACCGEPLGDDYHLDHIVPIALGGSNTDDNIQLLRQKCNKQKSTKHPVDFMQSRGYLL